MHFNFKQGFQSSNEQKQDYTAVRTLVGNPQNVETGKTFGKINNFFSYSPKTQEDKTVKGITEGSGYVILVSCYTINEN